MTASRATRGHGVADVVGPTELIDTRQFAGSGGERDEAGDGAFAIRRRHP